MDIQALRQITIEDRFSKAEITAKVKKDLCSSTESILLIKELESTIDEYMLSTKDYWLSKSVRVMTLSKFNDVVDIAISIAIVTLPVEGIQEVHRTVYALAKRLNGFDNIIDAVKTAAELLAVGASTSLYSLVLPKDSPTGVLSIYSHFELEDETKQFIANTQYLPPMVCLPPTIYNNFASQLLNQTVDHVILKTKVKHNFYQNLDAINVSSSIPYSLNVEMLNEVELPTYELDTTQKVQAYRLLVNSSKFTYKLMLDSGNKFYFRHKYDERGRKYCLGYHISTQSTEYKKSIVDFAYKQLIEVPEHMRNCYAKDV